MRLKHLILILLIPFSEIKAIFYNVDKVVSWYLFSDHQRQLCMVLEDYSNIIIFGVVFWFVSEEKRDIHTIALGRYLFCLNALDLIHLGLYDMQGFIIAKLVLAYGIYYTWSKLKPSY